eukprot:2366970-Pyramimonas_sp.AAC.1
MHTPNPGYPPPSSPIAPPLGGYIPSWPRAVGEAPTQGNEREKTKREDEGMGGREGLEGQEGGATMLCAASCESACAMACASHSNRGSQRLRRGSRHKQRHVTPLALLGE